MTGASPLRVEAIRGCVGGTGVRDDELCSVEDLLSRDMLQLG